MFLLTMQRYDEFTVCANNFQKNCYFVLVLLTCVNRKQHKMPENTSCMSLCRCTLYVRVHNIICALLMHDVKVPRM